MDSNELRLLLLKVKRGEIEVDEALQFLRYWPYEDLGFAKIDHHRSVRSAMPEVIYGRGKTPEQVAQIALSLWNRGNNVLITRSNIKQFKATNRLIPKAEYYDQARIIAARQNPSQEGGSAAVISAGTSDLRVAEEAAVTLEFSGIKVDRYYDVGVAGLHRLLDKIKAIRSCQVIIVVAGMDGALPSVVAGIVDKPVIAVPTSVGYGASFNGLSALLTMLNSCAPGVGVVNIDNGFGAAALAFSIIMAGWH